MTHAKEGDGKTKTYSTTSYASKVIMSLPKVKNLLNSWATIYKLSNTKEFSKDIEITKSDNSDLYYSLQHCKIKASISSNGSMHITITDKYNFDHFRTFTKDEGVQVSAGNIGNDLGLLTQIFGYITPFNITIYAGKSVPPYIPPVTSGEYEVKRYAESGTCYPQTTINFRSTPNAQSSSNIIGQYYKGEHVIYDLVIQTNKYVYISWIGANSGTRRYMTIRDVQTGERWATCV